MCSSPSALTHASKVLLDLGRRNSRVLIFCSVGKYVCHHAVLTRDQGYYVGARRFTTIGDVVDYFTDHPLGETTLKQEVRCYKGSFKSFLGVRRWDFFTLFALFVINISYAKMDTKNRSIVRAVDGIHN